MPAQRHKGRSGRGTSVAQRARESGEETRWGGPGCTTRHEGAYALLDDSVEGRTCILLAQLKAEVRAELAKSAETTRR